MPLQELNRLKLDTDGNKPLLGHHRLASPEEYVETKGAKDYDGFETRREEEDIDEDEEDIDEEYDEEEGDENFDILNLISASQKKQKQNKVKSEQLGRMMRTPDSVQRALHLQRRPKGFDGFGSPGVENGEDEEEPLILDEEEEEKKSSFSRGSLSPPAFDENKHSFFPLERSTPSETTAESIQARKPWQSSESKWLTVCKSLVEAVLERPRKELAIWALIVFLWVLSLLMPHRESVVTTTPTFTERQEPRQVTDQTSSFSISKAQMGKGPRITILTPAGGLRVASKDQVKIQMKVDNLFPEKFRLHRNPRVCLSLSSEHGSSSLGCMELKNDAPQLVLRDLAPGDIILHASLLSEVKKLAKHSLRISVVALADRVQSIQPREPEDGEECTTTCKQTCTRTFDLTT